MDSNSRTSWKGVVNFPVRAPPKPSRTFEHVLAHLALRELIDDRFRVLSIAWRSRLIKLEYVVSIASMVIRTDAQSVCNWSEWH
jgi:hypothetical protein